VRSECAHVAGWTPECCCENGNVDVDRVAENGERVRRSKLLQLQYRGPPVAGRDCLPLEQSCLSADCGGEFALANN